MEVTNFLNLSLPQNNENQDNWEIPVNENFAKIDEFCEALNDEISEASGNKKNLKEFLSASHDEDGGILRSDELIQASRSTIHGDIDESGRPYYLPQRLNLIDKDMISMINGFSSLDDKLSLMLGEKSMVLSGNKDSNGYPSWFGVTGVNAYIDGRDKPVWFMLNGVLKRINKQAQVQVKEVPAGTKYFWAKAGAGQVLASGVTGVVGSQDDRKNLFQDNEADFLLAGVRAGDMLTITSTDSTKNKGFYKIESVEQRRLVIVGQFPGATIADLPYEIRDTMAPDIGFSPTKEAGKFYFAEAYWDGSALVNAKTIHFNETFVGEWKPVELDNNNPNFDLMWYHNLFSNDLSIEIQVTENPDGTRPIEKLSVGSISSSLNVKVSSNLQLSPNEPQALTGAVSAALDGSVAPARSVAMQWTDKFVQIKNILPGIFYTSFDGNVKLAGHVRVICRFQK